MIMKHTWIYEQGPKGWSESLFRVATNPDLGIQWNLALLVGQKRLGWTGAQTLLKAIRVSIELDDANQPVRGDSLLRYTWLPGAAAEPSEDSFTALQIIFRNETASFRKFLFARGIWDNIVLPGGAINNGYWVFATNFDSWKSQLFAGQYGWMRNAQVLPHLAVIDYQQLPNMQVELTLAGANFPAPWGQKHSVMLSGINGKSVLNGRQVIEITSATTIRTVKQIAVGEFLTPGKVIFYTPQFVQATTIQDQKIVRRASGAPLLESRGRAKNRVRV